MHGPAQSRVDSTHFDRIVAVDLGKFNSVACVYEHSTQQHVFTSVATTPQALHDLLAEHAGDDPSRVHIGESAMRDAISTNPRRHRARCSE
jgi:hypothetical protein